MDLYVPIGNEDLVFKITKTGAACWTVWFDPDREVMGLVVGVGATVPEAKADAIQTLRQAAKALETHVNG